MQEYQFIRHYIDNIDNNIENGNNCDLIINYNDNTDSCDMISTNETSASKILYVVEESIEYMSMIMKIQIHVICQYVKG